MIEPRWLAKLPIVLLNFRAHLPLSWTVQLLTDPKEVQRASRVAQSFPLLKRALKRREMLIRPILLPTGHRSWSKAWYNLYLSSPTFWQSFKLPWLLLFEVDSALCPRPDHSLLHFVSADPHIFWGAPWAWMPNMTLRAGDASFSVRSVPVGNSGLSLWRRDFMASVSSELHAFAKRHQSGHSRTALNFGLRRGTSWTIDNGVHHFLADLAEAGRLPLPAFPDAQRAMNFSVETGYRGGVPFGVHRAHQVLAKTGENGYRRLLARCPAAAFAALNVSVADVYPSMNGRMPFEKDNAVQRLVTLAMIGAAVFCYGEDDGSPKAPAARTLDSQGRRGAKSARG